MLLVGHDDDVFSHKCCGHSRGLTRKGGWGVRASVGQASAVCHRALRQGVVRSDESGGAGADGLTRKGWWGVQMLQEFSKDANQVVAESCIIALDISDYNNDV